MNEPAWIQDALARVHAIGDRLPHALLVHGQRGWGEERVANALALELMHLEPGRSARQVAHPDLRWIQPEGGLVKVDDVRRIIDFLVHTPQVAGRKIAVIEDADRMNANAANALLKSLEEPPPESFIVLTTGARDQLPATVRSRCQGIELTPADPEAVQAWLAEAGVDTEMAGYLAVEYACAPFAIIAAAERGQAPLWKSLEKAGRSPGGARPIADSLRDEDLVDVIDRWLRILHWQLRRQLPRGIEEALDFAAELSRVREAALFNTGLNRSMQLHRLLLLWGELWRWIPDAEAPVSAW